MDTNYTGVKHCLDSFLAPGVLRDNARIVVVSSRIGNYRKLTAEVCCGVTDAT
jgi:NADP-dependent 3-hydroxy acid dehydrogenase YdfG